VNGFREFPGYPDLPERPARVEEVTVFLAAMQRERFDLIVQLHGSGVVTNPLAALLGGCRVASFYIPGQYCPDAELFLPWPERGPEVRRLLQLMDFLGVPPQGEELEFPLRMQEYQDLAAIEGTDDLQPCNYGCIHPEVSGPQRRWAVGGFAAVARALASQGFCGVLTATATEAPLTRAVASKLDAPPLDLAGRTGLGALATLLKGARLLVCNDTGVSHLTAALPFPRVVLSTGSNPERWAPLDRQRHRVLRQESLNRFEEVLAQVEDVLGASVGTQGREPCSHCVS
jgi:ADP-heptose:LPS heptosyltransferase